jgi:predicted nucleic acid-binding Zn ribbon protein
MSRNARYSHTRTVSEAFETFLDALGIREKYEESFVTANWQRLMGPTIAKRTNKVYLKRNTLYVDMSSASLKQDMLLSKSQIARIINEEIGKEIVKEVMFI